MQHDYAQAFIAIIHDGTPIDSALSGLKAALAKKHHDKLFVPILSEVLRVLQSEKGVRTATVTLAKATVTDFEREQIQAGLRALGVTTSTTQVEVVDETLIGGFIATFDHQEYDHSYKRVLKSLYESITA